MTDHPITPPPELVQQLCDSAALSRSFKNISIREVDVLLILEAFQAGADQELEACVEWFDSQSLVYHRDLEEELRAARRTKLPSLKEQALAALERYEAEEWCEEMTFDSSIIRRALEALND